jgi:FkbM family methyltransferase
MNPFLKNILLKVMPLESWLDTPVFRAYLKVQSPVLWQDQENERLFFKQLFARVFGDKKEVLVFDIGAYNGDKASLFLKQDARVISVEPDRENFSKLKARYKDNGRISVLNMAVSSQIGKAVFHVQQEGSPLNTLSTKWKDILQDQKQSRWGAIPFSETTYEVDTTTLDALISRLGVPDFIKIDVEGFEYEALRGLSKPVKMISFECNLPEFSEETLACIAHVHQLDPSYRFNYSLVDASFAHEDFLSHAEFMKIYHSLDVRYMEIYAVR